MLFLIPHVKEAQTTGNYSSPINIESPSTSDGIRSTRPTDSMNVQQMNECQKKKNNLKLSFEEEVLKAIKGEISEMDEDKTFCLSLVNSLKKMDDDNKMLAKIEILKVIRTFTNRSVNKNINQPNQSPNIEPFIEPILNHFIDANSMPSLPSTPISTQIQQRSQTTQVHDVHQQHSMPGTTFIYSPTPQQLSRPTFTQTYNTYQHHSYPTMSLQQSPSVNPEHSPKLIRILENCPANLSSRSNSAQSFFTNFNPHIWQTPSDNDQ